MEPLKHVQHLTQDIGPRPPTSASEARGAAYAASTLEEAGLDVRLEPFNGLRSFGDIYIPITATLMGAAAMGTAAKPRRLTGLMLAAAAFAAFVGENTARWRPITRLRAQGPSQNVVAVLPPKGDVRRRLVLVAHVDSSRSGWAFSPAMAPKFHRNAMTGVAAAFAAVIAWLLPRPLRRLVSAASTLVLGSSLAMLIQREAAGIDVEGANDNASGVAVLLSIAQRLTASPPEHTEVWFVVTGCEESDRIGMDAFLDRHAAELEDAWFLGFDTVAGPGTDVCWVTSSGMLEELAGDRYLTQIAERIASERPELRARPGQWRSAGLDTDNAIVRGFRALSLVALTPDGTLPNWHWPTDTFENIDADALNRCFELGFGIVTAFDREA